ncbi:hypothetical protein Htur_4395 (plasmid) [Haloterrigena turkmenica DSM 5511]|uniref:Uncharacterized protein n=1 Tax=Haloterrigena turkmenica (strain ATCC 51198 / DSM 5511 / JCM 9101 / NCIMB 13204 / VKM B-1734 / 4k) TaxID=543526 RepID=D2S1F9_HALTV|nr:hypothetical protein [Haloterrigena turkmenica]ADB63206.1 hypothetical protein Htur_4395 [Haloterrigena turkmenica DSM 5511]
MTTLTTIVTTVAASAGDVCSVSVPFFSPYSTEMACSPENTDASSARTALSSSSIVGSPVIDFGRGVHRAAVSFRSVRY